MEIKRFLGFTDNMSEPRKTEVETFLKSICKHGGKEYNRVNFLCSRVLKGYYLKEVWHPHDRHYDGAMFYRFYSPRGMCYFPIDRIEYDFVRYLMKNNLTKEDVMIAYDNADCAWVKASSEVC